MPNKEMPQFKLRCVKSDYPKHLIPNVVYTVDTEDKHAGEYATYWFQPIENRWCLIGYFPIICFDTTPIRNYIAKQKGEPIQDKARARPGAPKPRMRPGMEKTRQRPSIQKVRRRPGG